MSELSPIPNLDYEPMEVSTPPLDRGLKLPVYDPSKPIRPVKTIPKASQSAIIPDRRALALKRINDMQNEVGRLTRLLDELRADVLEMGIKG